MSPRTRTTSGPLSIQGEQQAHVQETLWADPTEGAQFLDALPPQYKFCRENRHRFDTPLRVETEPAGIPYDQLHKATTITQVDECACGATRSSTMTNRGVLIGSPKITYTDPEYLAKGLGRIPRESFGVLRLATVARKAQQLALIAAQAKPRRRSGRAAS